VPNVKRANTSGITKSGTAISDVPDAHTSVTATAGVLSASVTFTPAVTGGAATSYTVTSSPSSITGTGASSPITVSGLADGTSYTFTVTATNSTGTSPASSASNSVVPTGLGMYESIASVDVGSGGSSSVTFSSIPSTYAHLQLRWLGRTNESGSYPDFYAKVNGSTTAGDYYYLHYIQGDGSTANAGASNGTAGIYIGRMAGSGATSNVFAVGVCDILDYANTNKNKTFRSLTGYDNNGSGDIVLLSGLYIKTTAISSIELIPANNAGKSFQQYSSFALYGIKG